MSLPYALLGLVQYKPATGYDLKTIFTRSNNMFWNVSLPQIYRTLNQMEGNGWLSFTVEHQDGKPSRKVYQITTKGKEELDRWLVEPTDLMPVKSELMVKVFFGNRMDPKDLVHHIQECRERALRFLEETPKEVEATVTHFAAAAGADQDDTRFWLMTYDFGRRRAQMTVEWCDSAMEMIKKKKDVQTK